MSRVGVNSQGQGHHAVATGNGVAVIDIGVSARSGFGTKGGIVPSVGHLVVANSHLIGDGIFAIHHEGHVHSAVFTMQAVML